MSFREYKRQTSEQQVAPERAGCLLRVASLEAVGLNKFVLIQREVCPDSSISSGQSNQTIVVSAAGEDVIRYAASCFVMHMFDGAVTLLVTGIGAQDFVQS